MVDACIGGRIVSSEACTGGFTIGGMQIVSIVDRSRAGLWDRGGRRHINRLCGTGESEMKETNKAYGVNEWS